MATAAEQVKALAQRIAKQTNMKADDVEKVLKAGYPSTMEFVIDRIKAELGKTRAPVDAGNIDQFKKNVMVSDQQEIR